MKNENLTENGECGITGIMQRKNDVKILSDTIKRNAASFLFRAKQIHKNKYNYDGVIYMGSKSPVEIKCPLHGLFLQEPRIHLSGCGCHECGLNKTHNDNRITRDEWIRRSNLIHRNKYDYSLVSPIDGAKVTIICPKHGKFYQGNRDHLKGRGCPKCKTSKGENSIREWLETHNIGYKIQHTFNDCKNPKTNYKLRFDFYIPSKNLLIEYDGQQHFHSITLNKYVVTLKDIHATQYRDALKNNYAISHNIELLRIPYFKFKSISKILETKILK